VRNASQVIFFNDAKPLLERGGLCTFDEVHHAAGRLVDRNRNRDVLELPPLENGSIPYVKRFRSPTVRENRRLAVAEQTRIERFIEMGFPGPLCSAMGVSEREAFLLFLASPGVLPLQRFLRQAEYRGAETLLRELARCLARMHAKGLRMPDLSARHVLVHGNGRFYFIDLARLRFGQQTGALRDLARLFATLESACFPRTQRRRFLQGYGGDLRATWKKLIPLERRQRRAGRFPEMIPLVEKRGGKGKAYVHAEHSAELEEAGYREVNDFLAPASASLLRDIGVRMNYRVRAGGRTYFLKVHRDADQGRREWRNHLRLMRFDIPCAEPVAWGVEGERSFFMASACPGRTGEHLVPSLDASWRRTVENLGYAVARLHAEELYHRDLYLSHVVLDGEACRFIDLQRLEDGPLFKRHRQVKDLAALLYSSKAIGASRADALRFFRKYRSGGRLDGEARRLVRAVERKALRIAAHDRGLP
jgi:tRNA A-37 threonylcarbamoyl transferase component Bud32